MGEARTAVDPHRKEGGGGGLRPGWPGGGAAAQPGRPLGYGLRAGRPDRRTASVRDPRIQDGEGSLGPPVGPAAEGGDSVRGERQRRGECPDGGTPPRI